ncbi:9364_t:CDS:2, partial [Cetraspora pellucida]
MFNSNEFEVLKTISDGSSEVKLAYMATKKKHVVLKFLKEHKQDEYYKKFDRERSELKDTKKLKTFLALENREDPINLTPVDYKELYCDLWNSHPKKRPSISEVINRLNDIEFECVYQDSDYITEISLKNRIRDISKSAACLEVIKGSALNLYIFLPPGVISVGRSSSNDVIIKDQEIAKKHARITVTIQGQVEIKELESDYEIFVNDKKLGSLASHLLIRDDVISMGRSKFQYLPIGEYKSRMDELLSIYNVSYFLKKLENEFKSAKENIWDLSLLFFDLDHFKSINDQNNHIVGNYVLKELAILIQNNHVRSVDIFARYGGDEFTILLKGTNISSASKIAEEIRSSVETHLFIYKKTELRVTLSIGVSEMNSSVDTCGELLLQANKASKKAKEYGRNRVIRWNEIENLLKGSHDKSTECGNKDRASFSSFSSTADASFPSITNTSFISTMDASLSSTKDSSLSQIMDDEIGITIIKSDSENNETNCIMHFPRKETLKFIRTKLEYDEFYMGTNCHFIKNKFPVSRNEESKLNFLQIIEKHDNGNNFLYIKEKAEFDKLQLKNEKGFKFDKSGSIESASDKAFKIDINKIEFSDPGFVREEKEYKCNHAPNANCKRNLIIDEQFSVALEWFCNSLKLSWKHPKQSNIHLCEWRPKKEIIISDISATNEFISDVKAALKNNEKDIIKYLRDVSEKYGHFYARRLVLGGARVKNKSHIINSDEDAQSFLGDNTDNYTSVIGGDKEKYSENGIKSWDESLKDGSTWKIIGYDKIYSLFELLNEKLQKKVLGALGHRILKAGTEDIHFELKNSAKVITPYIHPLSPRIKEIGDVNNYQVFASIMSKSNKNLFSAHIDYVNKDKNTPVIVVHNIKRENSSSTTCKIKLGWIIVGPLTNFDFNVQYPLIFRSMKQMVSVKENHCPVKINNYKTCILGICALEADSESSSISNNDSMRNENSQLNSASIVDSTENIPYDIKYDPETVEIIVGTHFSTYKESACLFVYNLKDIDKPVDETVSQNLALYTCVVDVDTDEKVKFGQKSVEWESSKQEGISHGEIEPSILSNDDLSILSNDGLIFVSQLFRDCPNCPDCKRGFVNVNSIT